MREMILKSVNCCMTTLIRKHLFNVYFTIDKEQFFVKKNDIRIILDQNCPLYVFGYLYQSLIPLWLLFTVKLNYVRKHPKNVHIDPQPTGIWSIKLNVTLLCFALCTSFLRITIFKFK